MSNACVPKEAAQISRSCQEQKENWKSESNAMWSSRSFNTRSVWEQGVSIIQPVSFPYWSVHSSFSIPYMFTTVSGPACARMWLSPSPPLHFTAFFGRNRKRPKGECCCRLTAAVVPKNVKKKKIIIALERKKSFLPLSQCVYLSENHLWTTEQFETFSKSSLDVHLKADWLF